MAVETEKASPSAGAPARRAASAAPAPVLPFLGTAVLTAAIVASGVLVAPPARAALPPGPGAPPPGDEAVGEGEVEGEGDAQGPEEFTDDLIILKSDLAIEGKVLRRTEDVVKVEVDYGVLSIPTAAVKRIELNLTSRLNELAEDDYVGRYRLAMQAVEMGMTWQARRVLEELVGKPGIPPEIYRTLAKMCETEGELEKALEYLKSYSLSHRDDAEVKSMIAEIEKELGLGGGARPAGGVAGKPAGGAAGGKPAGGVAAAGGKPAAGGVTAAAAAQGEGIEVATWTVHNWGNPATVKIHDLDGNKVLMAEVHAGGGHDKAAFGRQVNLDLTGKKKLAFRAFNADKNVAQMALAIVTTDDYFESRPIRIGPGKWAPHAFPLQGTIFKSKATDWQFKTGVEGLDRVRQIVFLVYSGKRKALLYFDGMQAE